TQGNNIEVTAEIGITAGDEPTQLSQFSAQADNEIKGQSRGAKTLVRKPAITPVRIDDGHRRRKLIRRLVMIHHHDVEPKFPRRTDFNGIRNTAINRHDQAHPTLSEPSEPLDI